jgi:hypothetical protein
MKDNHWSIKHNKENLQTDWETRTPLTLWMKSGVPERAPLVSPVVLLMVRGRWHVICVGKTWTVVTWLRKKEHILDGDQTKLEVISSTLPLCTLGIVASCLAATLYQGNAYMKHKLWNILSTEIYTPYANALECCYIKWNFYNGRIY